MATLAVLAALAVLAILATFVNKLPVHDDTAQAISGGLRMQPASAVAVTGV
ncbi:hypothetical protein ACWD6P_36110 [Streptomyces sp. NPDC002446]